MRWGALVPATIAVAAACQGEAYFVCNDNGDCGAADGVCEPLGACSFPDPECDSGRRFGDASAPSIAGECTTEDDATSGATGTTSTSIPPTSEESSSETTDATTSTGADACSPDWWDCAWARRVRVSFAELPDPALTEFPVLVLLGPPRVDYDDLQADGEDLRFVSAHGSALPYEIEAWNPDGVSVVWVGVDEVGPASDHFFVYLRNPVAENAQDPGALWSPPHVAVWHLTEDTVDATANANHATAVGSMASIDGQIGSGQEPLANTSRLDVAASESLADVFVGGGTVSAWIRPYDWGAGDLGRIVHRDPGSVGFQFYIGATGNLRFNHHAAVDNPIWVTADEVLPLLRWSHVAVTYAAGSGVGARLFVDGIEQPVPEPPMVPTDLAATDAATPISLGNRPQNDRRFEGRLDEIRIERAIRSPEWIRLQHLSGRDALLVFGTVEDQGGVP